MPTCCQLVMLTCCNAGAKLACWHWHAERLKSGHAAALTCWHARPQCGLQSWLPSHVFSCCRVVVVAHMWPHVLCRLIAILVRPQWHIGKGHACLKQRNLPKTKPLAKYMDGSCCLNTWSGDASHRCHQLHTGVINYNDCKIQLLDLPGIISGAAQGKGEEISCPCAAVF